MGNEGLWILYVYNIDTSIQSITNPYQLSIVTLIPYQLRNSSISKSQHGDHRVGASAFPWQTIYGGRALSTAGVVAS